MDKERYTWLDSAEAFRRMLEEHAFTDDVECQYKRMLNFYDILYFRNGNSSWPPIATRHSAFYQAQAMLSLAIIDPSRTKEITYNMHVAGISIPHPLLTYALDGHNSEPVRLIQEALVLAYHKLISGRTLNDARLKELIGRIEARIKENGTSRQGIYAMDTIQSLYQVLPNLWVLMTFEIADRFYGTDHSKLRESILAFIREKLTDEKTGMYREFFKTGAFGVPDEPLSKDAFWATTDLRASVNAITIGTMHWFDPAGAEKAWVSFKEQYLEGLFALDAEAIRDEVCNAYLTALSPVTEALYGALYTAAEMEDWDVYGRLQDLILAEGDPQLREGKMFLDALGEWQDLHDHFFLFARTHLPWKTIMEYDWPAHYGQDWNKIR